MSAEGERLDGVRVLILEDEYYLATDLQRTLEEAGATVIGPFAGEAEAEAATALAETKPDCAFIDVNLGQGPSFAMPLALARQSVPFAFVTGYDAGTIPDEFADVARLQKPVDVRRIIGTAVLLLRSG